MREIKFRAWYQGELYPRVGIDLSTCELYKSDWNPNYMANPPWEGSIGLECDDLIVEQYTGLHDKNGREIYEGDIVKGIALCDFEYGERGWGYTDEVAFNHGHFYIKGYMSVLQWDKMELEVIGNIHQNPELLK